MTTATLPRAIFWDMEGTLVDTESLHFKAWQWLVSEYGEGTLQLGEYVPCVGHSGKENISYLHSLKHFRGDLEELRLYRYNKFDELRNAGVPPITVNIDLVKAIKSRHPDIRHFVVSSTTRKDIEINVAATGIADVFESLISYEEEPDMKRKPAPDLYLYAIKKAGIQSSEGLAFEDTESGVTAATDAGLRVIAVPTELTRTQNFVRASKVLVPDTARTVVDIL